MKITDRSDCCLQQELLLVSSDWESSSSYQKKGNSHGNTAMETKTMQSERKNAKSFIRLFVDQHRIKNGSKLHLAIYTGSMPIL